MVFGTGDRILRRGDYIWGAFVRPSGVDGYIVAMNPGDRTDVLGRFTFSVTSVDDAVGAAREGFRMWSGLTVGERVAAIQRYAEHLEEERDQLAVLITRETGKPIWEATEEVILSVRAVRALCKSAAQVCAPNVLREGMAWSSPEPLGVLGVICPFAFPLLKASSHLCAALLTGNTVVFKPSKFAPAVGQAIAERFDRCRLPRGTFNMVQGSGASVGIRIATHPGLDGLLFTGSHETAQTIQKALASRPELPVFFETGGKGSAVVLADADVDRAVYDLTVSAFLTSGQRHDNTGRAFVVRSHFEHFCEALTRRAQDLRIGYGFSEDIFMGPMISDVHRTRYREYARGLVTGGHMPLLEAGVAHVEDFRGFYVRPSLVWVNDGAHLTHEPPGPLLQLYCVEDAEEAVALHEGQAYRGSTAVYGEPDGAEVAEVLSRISSGYVSVNRGTVGAPLQLSSTGRGRSSRALPSGAKLMNFLVASKAVYVDRRPVDSSRAVPGIGPVPVAEVEEEPLALEPVEDIEPVIEVEPEVEDSDGVPTGVEG